MSGMWYQPPDQNGYYPVSPYPYGYAAPVYGMPVQNLYHQMWQINQSLMSDMYNLHGQLMNANQVIIRLENDLYRMSQEKLPREYIQDNYSLEWIYQERGGRRVRIGKLDLMSVVMVNMHEDSSFDCLYCIIRNEQGEYPVVIPYKDQFKKTATLLQHFGWHPDCPPNVFIGLFYWLVFKRQQDRKIMVLPECSGWCQGANGKPFFASSENVDPVIAAYYPNDVKERRLLKTDRALRDVAAEYAVALPHNWKYKTLVAIRLASLLLYFFEKENLISKQLVVIEQANEPNAEAIIKLLNTTNYYGEKTCSLSGDIRVLKKYVKSVNDGMVLLREDLLVEDKKKLIKPSQFLIDDLHHATGDAMYFRHIISIISRTPSNLPTELPVIHIQFDSNDKCCNIDDLQRLSGEFDYTLIHDILENSEYYTNLIHEYCQVGEGLDQKDELVAQKVRRNLELKNDEEQVDWDETKPMRHMIECALKIMEKFGFVTYEEISFVHTNLKHSNLYGKSSEQTITLEFQTILNKMLNDGNLKVSAQFSPPYFNPLSTDSFIDDQTGCLNIEASQFEYFVKSKMKTTQKLIRVLSALKECGKLHSRKEEYYRFVDVAISQDEKITSKVYSVSTSLMNMQNLKMLNEAIHDDLYFSLSGIPSDNFVPLVSNHNGSKVAGTCILSDGEVNYHMHVSGKTRYGKSYYLAQQAIFRTHVSDKIIIIDNNGSFTQDELRKHLSEEIISQYVSFCDVRQNMPIDLFSTNGCKDTPDKCDRIYGILSAAAKGFGETQESVLKTCLMKMLVKHTSHTAVTAAEILNTMDETNTKQKDIRDKIEYALLLIQEASESTNNWEEFLVTQKQVVILSTGDESSSVGTQLVDMLMASLYHYKAKHKRERYTVILDEIQDLGLVQTGILNMVLRKGGKMNLTFLLASQDYSTDDNEALGKVIGNTGAKVFFHPKDDRISTVASETGVSREQLKAMEQGECVLISDLYSKSEQRNCSKKIIGKVADVKSMPPYQSLDESSKNA